MIPFDRMRARVRAAWSPLCGRHAAGTTRRPTAPEGHHALSTPAPPLVCGDGVRADITSWVRAWLTQHRWAAVPA